MIRKLQIIVVAMGLFVMSLPVTTSAAPESRNAAGTRAAARQAIRDGGARPAPQAPQPRVAAPAPKPAPRATAAPRASTPQATVRQAQPSRTTPTPRQQATPNNTQRRVIEQPSRTINRDAAAPQADWGRTVQQRADRANTAPAVERRSITPARPESSVTQQQQASEAAAVRQRARQALEQRMTSEPQVRERTEPARPSFGDSSGTRRLNAAARITPQSEANTPAISEARRNEAAQARERAVERLRNREQPAVRSTERQTAPQQRFRLTDNERRLRIQDTPRPSLDQPRVDQREVRSEARQLTQQRSVDRANRSADLRQRNNRNRDDRQRIADHPHPTEKPVRRVKDDHHHHHHHKFRPKTRTFIFLSFGSYFWPPPLYTYSSSYTTVYQTEYVPVYRDRDDEDDVYYYERKSSDSVIQKRTVRTVVTHYFPPFYHVPAYFYRPVYYCPPAYYYHGFHSPLSRFHLGYFHRRAGISYYHDYYAPGYTSSTGLSLGLRLTF